MKFIRVDAVQDSWGGFSLGADEYLKALPGIQDKLPAGAREFAVDSGHYDFFGSRCVKDLQLDAVELGDRGDSLSAVVSFAPNAVKHDVGLTIRYLDVVEFRVEAGDRGPEARRLGEVQLDEILPHEHGCSHEVRLTRGRLWVVAADLLARWSG